MSNSDFSQELYVGVESPDAVHSLLDSFDALYDNFHEQVDGAVIAREHFDIERLHLVDQLMVLAQSLKEFDKSLPHVRLAAIKREEVKERLKERVKVAKKELDAKKNVEAAKKSVRVVPEKSHEVKRNEELERIRSFRKELEGLTKEISSLDL